MMFLNQKYHVLHVYHQHQVNLEEHLHMLHVHKVLMYLDAPCGLIMVKCMFIYIIFIYRYISHKKLYIYLGKEFVLERPNVMMYSIIDHLLQICVLLGQVVIKQSSTYLIVVWVIHLFIFNIL